MMDDQQAYQALFGEGQPSAGPSPIPQAAPAQGPPDDAQAYKALFETQGPQLAPEAQQALQQHGQDFRREQAQTQQELQAVEQRQQPVPQPDWRQSPLAQQAIRQPSAGESSVQQRQAFADNYRKQFGGSEDDAFKAWGEVTDKRRLWNLAKDFVNSGQGAKGKVLAAAEQAGGAKPVVQGLAGAVGAVAKWGTDLSHKVRPEDRQAFEAMVQEQSQAQSQKNQAGFFEEGGRRLAAGTMGIGENLATAGYRLGSKSAREEANLRKDVLAADRGIQQAGYEETIKDENIASRYVKKGSLALAGMAPALAGATAAAAVGGPGAGYGFWYSQSQGELYDGFRRSGMTEESAGKASAAAGVVHAAIMQLQASHLLGKGVSQAVVGEAKDVATKSVLDAFKNYGLSVAKGTAVGTADTALMEAVKLATMKAVEKLDPKGKIDWEKEYGQSKDAVIHAMSDMSFITAVTHAPNLAGARGLPWRNPKEAPPPPEAKAAEAKAPARPTHMDLRLPGGDQETMIGPGQRAAEPYTQIGPGTRASERTQIGIENLPTNEAAWKSLPGETPVEQGTRVLTPKVEEGTRVVAPKVEAKDQGTVAPGGKAQEKLSPQEYEAKIAAERAKHEVKQDPNATMFADPDYEEFDAARASPQREQQMAAATKARLAANDLEYPAPNPPPKSDRALAPSMRLVADAIEKGTSLTPEQHASIQKALEGKSTGSRYKKILADSYKELGEPAKTAAAPPEPVKAAELPPEQVPDVFKKMDRDTLKKYADNGNLYAKAELVNRAVPKKSGGEKAPNEPTPAPVPGTVRFYHGGEGEGGKGKRWFSPDKAYAEGYAAKSVGGKVSYIDLPEGHPLLEKAFNDEGLNMKSPYINFEAPEEIAKGRKLFIEGKPKPESVVTNGEPGKPAVEPGRVEPGKPGGQRVPEGGDGPLPQVPRGSEAGDGGRTPATPAGDGNTPPEKPRGKVAPVKPVSEAARQKYRDDVAANLEYLGSEERVASLKRIIAKHNDPNNPVHVEANKVLQRMLHEHGVNQRIEGNLDRSELPEAMKGNVRKWSKEVLDRMPDKALEHLHKGAGTFEFYPSSKELADQLSSKGLKIADRDLLGDVVGFYRNSEKKLFLLAGEKSKASTGTDAGIYAHEKAHAVDGPEHQFSKLPEWKAAWEAELKDGQVSKYAGQSPREGLAEVGRKLWGEGADPVQFREKFPKVAEFWDKHGLMPKDKPAEKGAVAKAWEALKEIFSKPVETKDGIGDVGLKGAEVSGKEPAKSGGEREPATSEGKLQGLMEEHYRGSEDPMRLHDLYKASGMTPEAFKALTRQMQRDGKLRLIEPGDLSKHSKEELRAMEGFYQTGDSADPPVWAELVEKPKSVKSGGEKAKPTADVSDLPAGEARVIDEMKASPREKAILKRMLAGEAYDEVGMSEGITKQGAKNANIRAAQKLADHLGADVKITKENIQAFLDNYREQAKVENAARLKEKAKGTTDEDLHGVGVHAFEESTAAGEIPRNVSKVGPGKGTPGAHAIIKEMGKQFDLPIRPMPEVGKAKALYHDKPEAMFLGERYLGDLGVASHDVAHHNDMRYRPYANAPAAALRELAALDYNPQLGRVNEGFSEYVRKRYTADQDPAPAFTKHFDKFLDQHPELKQKLGYIKGLIDDWRAATPVERAGANIKRINEKVEALTGSPPTEKARNAWNWLVDRAKDELLWSNRLTERAKSGGAKFKPGESPEDVARAVNKGDTHLATTMLEEGVFSPTTGKKLGGPLKEYTDGLSDAQKKNLAIYMHAQFAKEMHEKNPAYNPGMPLQEAQRVVNALQSRDFDARAEKYRDFHKAMGQALVDVGFYTKGEYKAIYEATDHYMPVERVADEHGTGGTGKGVANVGDPVGARSELGSDAPIIDPGDVAIRRAGATATAINKQLVINAVADAVHQAENIGPFGSPLTKAEAVARGYIDEPRGNVASILQSMGIANPAETSVRPKNELGKDIVVRTLDSKGEAQYTLLDKDVMRGLAGTDAANLPFFLTPLVKLSNFTKMMTTGLSATFGARNIGKDLPTYLGNVKYANPAEALGKPAEYAAIVAADLWKRKRGGVSTDPIMQLFRREGGELSNELRQNDAGIQWYADKILGRKSDSTLGNLKDTLVAKVHTARDVISIGETAYRVAQVEFTLREHGWTKERIARQGIEAIPRGVIRDAMNDGARVTVDFKRMGSWGKSLNAIMPYFNAGFEGNANWFRLARENPKRWALGTALSAGAGLAYWALVKDEDWWQKASPHLKYGHFVIPDFSGNPFLRIPMNETWGTLTAGGSIALADAMFGKDKQFTPTMKEYLKHAGEGLQPFRPFAGQGAVEAMANYDIFRKKPIVNEAMAQVQPKDQYQPWTTESIKLLGQMFNLSPARMEHFLDGISGGMTTGVLGPGEVAVGAAMRAGGSDTKMGSGTTLERLPVVKGFTLAGQQDETRQQFAEKLQAAKQAYNSTKLHLEEEQTRKGLKIDHDAVLKQVDAKTKGEYTRLNELNQLSAKIREQKVGVVGKEERFATEKYEIGLARYALGEKELSRYPNPLTAQGLPGEVAKIRDHYLAGKVEAATEPRPRRQAGESIEHQEQQLKEWEAKTAQARDQLRTLGISRDRQLELLKTAAQERATRSGLKAERGRVEQGRIYSLNRGS